MKQEEKIIRVIKESANLSPTFSIVDETYKAVLSQKKYLSRFKW